MIDPVDVGARIAVDLRPLLAARTGVGKYQAAIMRAIMEINPNIHYLGFGSWSWTPVTVALLDAKTEHKSQKFNLNKIGEIPYTRAVYQTLRSAAYKVTLQRKRADFFHAFLYRPPAFSSMPFLPVVYDLSNKRLPQYHPLDRIRWMSQLDRHLSDAPLIHTISEFSANEIVDVYGIAREKIIVVPPGVDDIFFKRSDPLMTLARFDLYLGEFFLCVGTLEPRKNIATLVRAYANASPLIRERLPLVLVGMKGWSDAIPHEAMPLLRSGAIRILGYVTDAELRDLYASARAMLYPSIYEGFGMPIAEAKAAGARVIVSDIPPHHEASADDATFVPAMDIDGWKAALTSASEMKYSIADQSTNRFTWRQAADRTLEMYLRMTLVSRAI